MSTYTEFLKQQTLKTPQTEIPLGQEKHMVQGASGGYAFKTTDFQHLRRCLLMGTSSNGYYAGAKAKTAQFIDVLNKCIAENPSKVAEEILYARDGRTMLPSACVLALTLLSMSANNEAKALFIEIFPKVIRTASQFYEWMAYSKTMRGFGKVVRSAGRNWLLQQETRKLAYQLLKYQNREGFTHRDVLRLLHPKPSTPEMDQLFEWATKGWSCLPPLEKVPESLHQIYWFEYLKKNPSETVRAIQQGNFTLEMAQAGVMNKAAWKALLPRMPATALLRNLGAMTYHGVIDACAIEELNHIEKVLCSVEVLKAARVHPLAIMKALRIYTAGGAGGKSDKRYVPVARLINILEKALDASFQAQTPTNKMFGHFIDVSGSMNDDVSGMGMSAVEVATLLTMASLKAEPNYYTATFDTNCRAVTLPTSTSFTQAMNIVKRSGGGGTDCSQMFEHLLDRKIKLDVVVGYTDNESWAGRCHTYQALEQYRQRINPKLKVVLCSLTVNNLTLSRPNDELSLDISGCTPDTPRLIQMFANGEMD